MSSPLARRAPRTKRTGSTAAATADPPAPSGSGSLASGNVEIERDQIARLAYSYWEARGCQEGSPDEDWLRAEQQLRAGKQPAGPAGETPARKQT